VQTAQRKRKWRRKWRWRRRIRRRKGGFYRSGAWRGWSSS
jgi:hypothetical protein